MEVLIRTNRNPIDQHAKRERLQVFMIKYGGVP